MLSETLLLNLFFAMFKIFKFCIYSMPTGRSPTNLLLLMSKTVVVFNKVISSGKQPERSLLEAINSSSLPAILPMLRGMHPLSLLLERTTTEAGELPKFSEIVE
jgi:hypothetical protein